MKAQLNWNQSYHMSDLLTLNLLNLQLMSELILINLERSVQIDHVSYSTIQSQEN